jgi:fructosamine-3-kinase
MAPINPLWHDAALAEWNDRRRLIFYPKTDIEFALSAMRWRKDTLGSSDLAFLHEKLPGIQSIEFLPNAGTLHAIFRVVTSGKNYFLKLPLTEPDFSTLVEAWAQAKCAEFGIQNLVQPNDLRLMEEAPGQCLTKFEDPETQAMPAPLLFNFGRALALAHRIECVGAGFLDPGTLANARPSGIHRKWSNYIWQRLKDHLETCQAIEAISAAEATQMAAVFESAAPLLAGAPMRLLHGDPGHHNVFSEGKGITAIIDWEDALAGDPIFDIAYWGTFVRDEMRAEFLEGYQTVSPLPADFERRYWLYYLRVALSKTVHRHRFGAKGRPGRPPASRRIQKALSKLAEL